MTRFDSDRRHRRSIRLRAHDYGEAGAYFVTICTHERECLFGHVADGVMLMNGCGENARACWLAIPQHFPNVQLDSFVIMPNHVHGILILTDLGHRVGAQHAAPLPDAPLPDAPLPDAPLPDAPPPHAPPPTPVPTPLHDGCATRASVKPGSLGAIIRSFKSAVTKRVNEGRDTTGAPVWQRNYYEHIVRSERELDAIRHYITNNPANWQLDADNPANSAHLPPPATVDDYIRDADTREAGT